MSPAFNLVAVPGTTWAHGGTWSFTGARRFFINVVLAVAMAMAVIAPFSASSGRAAVDPARVTKDLVQVFIRAAGGAGDKVEQAVADSGGTLERRLGGLNGFVAQVPKSAITGLRAAGGIMTVAPNAPIELDSIPLNGDALRGGGSMDFVRKVTGAQVSDKQSYDGSGIGVAVLDSGVNQVPGLDGTNKVFYGPDVSFDGGMNPSVKNLDEFGHGTHLAGIIAGSDPVTGGSTNGQRFLGEAEQSRIVSLKVASANGDTDVLMILSAIDWVVQHKNDPGVNIKVLNLSFGLPNPGDYRTDALAWAVERAWKAGIVVVVAAGNQGTNGGITSPGTDPYVITVGGVDNKTTEDISDDTVSTFSPVGTPARRVDLVAPAQSDISLRVPGSAIDTNYPAARVGDSSPPRFFKGTGTSQAAAIVSGAAADLLEQRPSLTPDQVKAILKSTANVLPAADPVGQGAGMVCVKCALRASTPTNVTQNFEPANVDGPQVGAPAEPAEAGVTGGSWTGGSWTGGSWTGGSWTGGSWTGNVWSGGSWTGGSWTGGSWTGGSWTGGSWTGGSWTGGSWTGGSWTGGSWTGGSWTGGSWTGGSWTGGSWTGGSWTGGSWTGGSWTGGSWTGGSWTGGSWTGGSWTGGSWTGGSWTGGSWTGGSWTGGSWTGGSWTGGSWTGGSWTGGSWTGGSWTGGSWTGGSWTGGSWTGGSWTDALWA